MFKKIVFTAAIVLTFIGLSSAQYCPTPGVRGNAVYSNSLNNFSSTSSLNSFIYDFAYAIDRGYRTGELTRHEVFTLENGLDRLKREIQRAYFDGRMSSSEWTFIGFDIRNLQRDLEREWNDDQIREIRPS